MFANPYNSFEENWTSEAENTSNSQEDVRFRTISLRTDLYRLFTLIIIMCIILGATGNACFCSLFGNPRTRIYKTRDALYIRRLSTFDMLICVIILPYSIIYEARLVRNNTLCKTMEFIRHTLTYVSHLMLSAYSFELPRRLIYVKIKKSVDIGTIIIILLSCCYSFPVLYLFEVKEDYDDTVVAMVESIHSCQMVHMIKTNLEVDQQITLLILYYYTCLFINYIATFIFFIYKTMHYIEKYFGQTKNRRSVGVFLNEHGLCPSSTLKHGRWRHRVSRHSQTGHRIVLAEYLDSDSDRRPTALQFKTRKLTQYNFSAQLPSAQLIPMSNNKNVPTGNTKAHEIQSYLPNTDDSSSDLQSDLSLPDDLFCIEADNAHHETDIDLATRIMSNATLEDNDSDLHTIQSTTISEDNDSEIQKNKLSLYNLKSGISSFWKTEVVRKSNLKDPSVIEPLKIESYKKTLMFLILLDFIFMLMSIVIYFLLMENSAALNLIHTKCVFSFYYFCLVDDGLRMAVLDMFYQLRSKEQKRRNNEQN